MAVQPASNRLFCFGYGYTADHLAASLRAQGNWQIAGTTRDAERKAQLQGSGIDAYVFDTHRPLSDPRLFMEGATHLLISTPPDDDGDPAYLHHWEDIAAIKTLRWIGYLSSTAVYGDRDGGWVDETAELRPTSKRGSRRARAEAQYLSLYQDEKLPVEIFRLAGIYGPGRSALDSVRAGNARRIDKPGHAFSRIHVADIVQTLMASMAKPNPGRIYNVCDDEAAPSHQLIGLACSMLDIEPMPLIPYEQADLAPITRSFYSDNKRIRNDRIKEELGVRLLYPDFRSGLQACLDGEAALRLIPQRAEAAT